MQKKVGSFSALKSKYAFLNGARKGEAFLLVSFNLP